MRFVILLLAVILASCATPKTAPQAFYEGVYVPGAATFADDGLFVSKAGVTADEDIPIARKAAYARFMLAAKNKGYKSFEVINESRQKFLGTTFILEAKAYKSMITREGVYSIDAIKRLLNDLPLEEPKPIVVAKPKPVVAAKLKPRKPKAVPVRRPVTQVKEVILTPTGLPVNEEPMVIMAPEDITGSIKAAKNGTVGSGALTGMTTSTGISLLNTATVPDSLVGVPQGVKIRQR